MAMKRIEPNSPKSGLNPGPDLKSDGPDLKPDPGLDLKPGGPSLKPDDPSFKPDEPRVKPVVKVAMVSSRSPAMELELALYEGYTHGVLRAHFKKGVVYRFSEEKAQKLLSEQDMGRPVWKVYEEPQPEDVARRVEQEEAARRRDWSKRA